MAKGRSALRYSSGTAPEGITGCICPDKLHNNNIALNTVLLHAVSNGLCMKIFRSYDHKFPLISTTSTGCTYLRLCILGSCMRPKG